MAIFSSLYDHAQALVAEHPWASLIGLLLVSQYLCRGPDLSHIPTAGSSGISSYWDGLRFMFNAEKMLEEGYRKFRGGTFRVAMPSRWQVLITSLDMINELRLAADSDLSFSHAAADHLQAKYTVGTNTLEDNYHVGVVQTPLTRSLGAKYEEVYDEITQAFEELVPANEKDWLSVPLSSTALQLICRTSNRLFLGLPLCRNSEWIDLNINYTIDVFLRATVINLSPGVLKPLLGHMLCPAGRAMRIGRKYLSEEVQHRIEMDDEHGKNYEGRPNDLISWLLEYAKGEERTVDRIIQRLLAINIAAIHTTSNSLMLAILNLAAHPEHVAPLREEVTEVVNQHGWTKAALSKMRKVDSFLKESARFEGISATLVNRMVVNPAGFTFRNGLHLPYGTFVGIPTHSIHRDADYYANPLEFDGFRYSKMRNDNNESTKHQMVNTQLDYLNFGHGKHACPGRFFAVNELKTVLAYLVLRYDIALDGDSKPKFPTFGVNVVPSNRTKVLFKRLPDQCMF